MAFVDGAGLADDLDGSTDQVHSVWIGLEGELHEIDLSVENRQQLLRLLGWYARRGRPLPTGVDDPATGATGLIRRRQALRQVLVDVVPCEDLSVEERQRLGGEMQVQVRVISAMRSGKDQR